MESFFDSSETNELLQSICQGDSAALDDLLEKQRPYLRRLIDVHLDGVLRRRIDQSDVIQETLFDLSRRVDDYLRRRPCSFRLWVRRKALQHLIDLRRRHNAQKRDVRRDLALTDASSVALARSLFTSGPSGGVCQEELARHVRQAVTSLPDTDREILILRNAEELTNAEVAELLQLDPKTASKRYGRALYKLSLALAAQGITHA